MTGLGTPISQVQSFVLEGWVGGKSNRNSVHISDVIQGMKKNRKAKPNQTQDLYRTIAPLHTTCTLIFFWQICTNHMGRWGVFPTTKNRKSYKNRKNHIPVIFWDLRTFETTLKVLVRFNLLSGWEDFLVVAGHWPVWLTGHCVSWT